jgi:drug/metabolite transporter (DMT)-like permease
MHKLKKTPGYLAVMGASILWGTTYPIIKFGLSDLKLSPITFLSSRFLLSIIILSPLLLNREARKDVAGLIRKPDIMILGLVNGAAYSFQFIGQDRVSSMLAAIMLNTYVLFAPLFARALLGANITPRQKISTLIGFLGTAVIAIGNITGTGDLQGSILGVAMVLSCGVLYGLYIVYSEKNLAILNKPIRVFYASTIYSVLLILIAGLILRDLPGIRPLPLEALLPVAYLSVFCTAIAFILYLFAIHRLGSVDSAIYLLLNIIVGIVLSYFMLGEVPDLFIFSGAALIFLSISLLKGIRSS